jgi:hypothetical protein
LLRAFTVTLVQAFRSAECQHLSPPRCSIAGISIAVVRREFPGLKCSIAGSIRIGTERVEFDRIDNASRTKEKPAAELGNTAPKVSI